jgi:hypothetical protein
VDAQHSLIVIDQEVIVIGHALGAFVGNRNSGRDKETRLFMEQEIMPTLFRNLETFRDIFAISLADTFSIDDLRNMILAANLESERLDREKSAVSASRFHNAAMVFAGSLLASLSADTNNRLKEYGLQ